MSPYNFGDSGSLFIKLFPGDVPRGSGDKMGVTFGRPAPWNLGQRKNRPYSAWFLTTFDFGREYLRKASTNRKSEEYFINHNPFPVGRKKLRDLWSTNKKVIGAHTDPPKRAFFGRLYFGPWGCCPLNFLYRLQIDQALLAHTPAGMGVSPKILIVKKIKFGLKFSVWAGQIFTRATHWPSLAIEYHNWDGGPPPKKI